MKGRRFLPLLWLLLCPAALPLCAQTVDFTAFLYNSTPSLDFCAGDNVLFRISGDQPDVVKWDFGEVDENGDAIVSIDKYPAHPYNKAGTYKVTLYAVYTGKEELSVTKTLIIHPPPEVDFSPNIAMTCQRPVDITFTDNATVPGERTWIFGDEGRGKQFTTKENSITHTYAVPEGDLANYGVELVFKDKYGCKTHVAHYIRNDLFRISIGTITPSEGCLEDERKFLGYSIKVDPKNPVDYFTWDFGDGSPLLQVKGEVKNGRVETTVFHAYAKEGDFLPKLTVMTTTGCTSTQIANEPVHAAKKPTATVTLPDFDCSSSSFHFVADKDEDTDIDTWEWDFGDGTTETSSSNTAYHTFHSIGKKVITLHVYNNTCKSEPITKLIEVQGPAADFDLALPECNGEQTFRFTDKSFDADILRWDFGDPASGDANFSTGETTPAHTYRQSGEYLVTLHVKSNINGCEDELQKKIFAVAEKPVLRIPSYDVCKNVPITLQATEAPYFTRYSWNFGDQTSQTGKAASISKAYDQRGTYPVSVTVKDAHNCLYTITAPQPLRVYTPTPLFDLPEVVCFNQPAVFTDRSVPDAKYALTKWTWTFGDGDTKTTQNVEKTFTTSGMYDATLKITDQHGCSADTTRSFRVNPSPVLVTGQDSVTVCEGQKIRLLALSDEKVIWMPDYELDCAHCEAAMVSPRTDTLYKVRVINQYGCAKEDSVYVTVHKDFRLKVSDPVMTPCYGDSVELQVNGAFRYKWDSGVPGACDTCNSIWVRPDRTTTYYVNGYDEHACFIHQDSVKVVVTSLPSVDLEAGLTVVAGNPVTLHAATPDHITGWLWEPADYLNCTICPDPIATPERPLTYRVTVTNELGCKNSDSIRIKVICSGGGVFIPNTFTPNSDGVNDRFYPHGKGVKQVRYFNIYNRWGQLVFSRTNFQLNDRSMGWDGTSGGQKLPAGVYVYISEMVCVDDIPFPVKGNITLLR